MRWFQVFFLLCIPAVSLGQERFADLLDQAEDKNGFVISFLEDQLSTDARKIRVSGVSGLLSSSATVAQITVSDREGVWLLIKDATVIWDRTALFNGAVEVEELSAQLIEYRRNPVAEKSNLPSAQATAYRVPDLPVSVDLRKLKVDQFRIGETVLGTGARMALEGNLSIGGGVLDTQLTLQRLDGPGGSFVMTAGFNNATENLSLDMSLQEPPGGILTTLAGINGLPALDLKIAGEGPLSDLGLNLSFLADGKQFLSGALNVSGVQQDRSFGLELKGLIAPLLGPGYQAFFDGESALTASGRRKPGGGIALGNLDIRTASLYLTGWLETTPDGFLSEMNLSGGLGRADETPLILPLPDEKAWLKQAALEFRFNGNKGWDGAVSLQGLEVNDVKFAEGQLVLDGQASNIDLPDKRALSGRLTGTLRGISTDKADLQAAFGEEITLLTDFSWAANQPFDLRQMRINGRGLALNLQGAIRKFIFDGRFSAQVDDLAAYSALMNQDLAGAIRFESTGSLAPISGAFDLRLDGATTDLAFGTPQLDGLLRGETRLTGRVARTLEGTETEALKLANDQFSMALTGRILAEEIGLDLRAQVNNLSVISEDHAGTLSLIAGTSGRPDDTQISVNMTMPEGRLNGHPIDNLTLSLTGQIKEATRFAGQILGYGTVDDNSLFLTGELSADDRLSVLRKFNLSLGAAQMNGTLGQGGDGLYAGTLSVWSPDIEPIASLFLTDARGAVDVTAELSRAGSQQRLRLNGGLKDLAVAGIVADSAEVDVEVLDLFGLPLFDGTAAGAGLQLAGQKIARFVASSERTGDTMAMQATTQLDNGTELRVVGDMTNLNPGVGLALEQLDVSRGDIRAALARPAEARLVGQRLTLRDVELDFGEGSFRADGQLGPTNNLSFQALDLPLQIATLVTDVPGIAGTVGGIGRITGSADDPSVQFDLRADDATIGVVRALGIPPLDARATGQTREGHLAVQADVSAGEDLALDVKGAVPITTGDEMDLAVNVTRFPLALLNVVSGNPGLAGQVRGQAALSGTFADPLARFDLTGSGLSAQVMRANGIPALSAAVAGSFADNQIFVKSASVEGPAGGRATGSGRIPLSGSGLDFSLSGRVPLTLVNIALADTGIQISGLAQVSAQATGRLAAPDLSGSVEMNDGILVDPRRNVRINDLRLGADLSGDRMVIREAQGNFSRGGTITASGSLGLSPTAETDLNIRLDGARYTDGVAVDTTVSGSIAVTGPLARSGRVMARLSLGTTEVAVAERFGIQEGVLLDVTHRNTPRDVTLTLRRAGVGRTRRTPSNEGRYFLDLVVDAPNRIFIRGRGLDVEMGGALAVRGPVQDLQPVGRFELLRGRMSVLGQRLAFTEGWIEMSGDFDPEIRLEAQTAVQGSLIGLLVTGPVSDPAIELFSSPELPQDEILALLIFQRDLASLSPFQIAQLASAAATLAGKGGSFLDDFRAQIGLDDLEIVSDDEGDFGVRAGAYINEKLYLDVEAQSSGETLATVNLDITDNVRAKASFGSDGEGSVGVFYERDY
ncbi:translocation/assembly module TamB domain-containing protein [Halovulum sp. GXIMD14793]